MEGARASSGRESKSTHSKKDWVSEWLVRAIFLTAIVGLLAPLFVEALASLPVFGQEIQEVPVALIAIGFGATIPILSILASKLVSDRMGVQN